MLRGECRLILPNPHRGDISVDLLRRILRRAGVSREEWLGESPWDEDVYVVSNTSPVLNLAIIGRLSLLREQFEEIWIPAAVLEELRLEEDLPGSRVMREAIDAKWLRVEEVKDQSLVHILQRDLDKGEAEAIALALQMKAEWTLLDEREARRIAKSLGLKVIGL